ncbi:MAG TPA: ABC transporter permease, partial [Stellaceae bacterium]|nr:ABC transporter permease [Stellaceae bacterium]
MTRFVVTRALEVLVVLAVMSFIIYALIGLMPGDPIDQMLTADPHLTVADAARLKALYGLDRPLAERYLAWARAALEGDFGYSRLYATPAVAALLPRLGNTALLMLSSFVLSLAIALPLGAAAARRPGSVLDGAANLLSFAGMSIPSFWFALVLILVFAVALGWLPAGGIATIGDGDIIDRARHLALPVVTLTIASIGTYLRFMRAAMIEALRQDYVRTARAKGASERRV